MTRKTSVENGCFNNSKLQEMLIMADANFSSLDLVDTWNNLLKKVIDTPSVKCFEIK